LIRKEFALIQQDQPTGVILDHAEGVSPRNLWYNLFEFNWMMCVLIAARPSYGLAAFSFRRTAGH